MCKKVSEKSDVTRDWAAHLKLHELVIWLKPDCCLCSYALVIKCLYY